MELGPRSTIELSRRSDGNGQEIGVTILNEIAKLFHCVNCDELAQHEVMCIPVQLLCGHLTCKRCAKRLSQCPACHKDVQNTGGWNFRPDIQDIYKGTQELLSLLGVERQGEITTKSTNYKNGAAGYESLDRTNRKTCEDDKTDVRARQQMRTRNSSKLSRSNDSISKPASVVTAATRKNTVESVDTVNVIDQSTGNLNSNLKINPNVNEGISFESLETQQIETGLPNVMYMKESEEYVGFANLPNHVYRKVVKEGFDFTLMVAGGSGLGKSTLLNSMFLTDVYSVEYPGPSLRVKKTVQVETNRIVLKENGINLTLTIVDTPGFGEALDNRKSCEPVVKFVESRYEDYLNSECRVDGTKKSEIDARVHVCLYFIAPTGHGLKPLDIEFMKQLSDKVNLIPVIGKADTMTPEECTAFKKQILNELTQQKIKIYSFPDIDDEEENKINKQMRDRVPFAVVGSNTILEIDGKKLRGRKYPWGTVVVENMDHSDFVPLRNLILRTHLQDLKDVTNNVHYANYRARKLTSNNDVFSRTNSSKDDIERNPFSQVEEDLKRLDEKMKKMEELEITFETKVTSWNQRLLESELDLQKREANMRISLEKLEREIEDRKKLFETERHVLDGINKTLLDDDLENVTRDTQKFNPNIQLPEAIKVGEIDTQFGEDDRLLLEAEDCVNLVNNSKRRLEEEDRSSDEFFPPSLPDMKRQRIRKARRNALTESVISPNVNIRSSCMPRTPPFTPPASTEREVVSTVRNEDCFGSTWTPAFLQEIHENENPPKRKFVFCSTRLSREQLEKLDELCTLCHGEIRREYTDDVTHLILTLEKNRISQTMKYLFAIAGKKWTVTFEWVLESLRQGHVVSETPFETANFPECDQGVKISRLTQSHLFHNFKFYVPIDIKSSGIPATECKKLLTLLGGVVLEELPSGSERLLIIGDLEDFTINYQNLYEDKGWLTLAWDWILECTLTYSLIPFSSHYVLTPGVDGIVLSQVSVPLPLLNL